LPRKFSGSDKNTWLELFDRGKSEKQIAKEDAQCDTRTIKKGIDQARRVRIAREAQVELVKDALRNHQNDLLRTMEGIKAELQVPPPDLAVPGELEKLSSPVPVAGVTVRYAPQEGPTVVFQRDDSIMWELLGEHLKRTRTWTRHSRSISLPGCCLSARQQFCSKKRPAWDWLIYRQSRAPI